LGVLHIVTVSVHITQHGEDGGRPQKCLYIREITLK